MVALRFGTQGGNGEQVAQADWFELSPSFPQAFLAEPGSTWLLLVFCGAAAAVRVSDALSRRGLALRQPHCAALAS